MDESKKTGFGKQKEQDFESVDNLDLVDGRKKARFGKQERQDFESGDNLESKFGKKYEKLKIIRVFTCLFEYGG